MFLGISERVKPLITQVRAMIRDEVMPLEHEYEAEIGKAETGKPGDRFVHTARQIPDLGPTTRPTPNPGIAAPAPAIPGP